MVTQYIRTEEEWGQAIRDELERLVETTGRDIQLIYTDAFGSYPTLVEAVDIHLYTCTSFTLEDAYAALCIIRDRGWITHGGNYDVHNDRIARR